MEENQNNEKTNTEEIKTEAANTAKEVKPSQSLSIYNRILLFLLIWFNNKLTPSIKFVIVCGGNISSKLVFK